MARWYMIGGVRFYRRSLVKLSTNERAALAATGQADLRRRVEWPLPDHTPDFGRAYTDPGGTDIWGPGPYLKVPSRIAGDDDWQPVNRVFCPWGYPPDRVRVARSAEYLRLAAVELVRAGPEVWEWVLSVVPWVPAVACGPDAEPGAGADRRGPHAGFSKCVGHSAAPAAELGRSAAEARGVDLDLQQDAADVSAYVASRAVAFTPAGNRGPGGVGPVKVVYAGYNFDQSGWFALVFDRRPDAGHDGEWTLYLDGNMLDRPRWVAARERNEALPIRVRGEDGVVRELPPGTHFGWLLGRVLVGVLQRAERDGMFARLPRADGFWLGLEEFHGSLGWDSRTGYGGEPE